MVPAQVYGDVCLNLAHRFWSFMCKAGVTTFHMTLFRKNWIIANPKNTFAALGRMPEPQSDSKAQAVVY